MKILQINCVYNRGSTGRLTADIHHGLQKNNIESVVCYGRGEKINEKNVYKVCCELYSHFCHFLTRLSGFMYGSCFISTFKLLRLVKKEKPDIVHLQCINGYFVNIYYLINWLKRQNIKTVLTLHAEFMYTGNCGHALECVKWKHGCHSCDVYKKETESYFLDCTADSWRKMKQAFDGKDDLVVVSVSEWLKERALQSDILKQSKHLVIYNGVDTSVFRYNSNTDELRKKYKIDKNTKIVLYVTASFRNTFKGGEFFVTLAEENLGNDIVFIIIGNEEKNYTFPGNVIDVGRIEEPKVLSMHYSMADVLILTSRRETFSMPVAESLCCGTPVIGFKAGAPEQIALREYSKFVEYGDIMGLQKELIYFLNQPFDNILISKKAKKYYSKDKMIREYLGVYNELLKG